MYIRKNLSKNQVFRDLHLRVLSLLKSRLPGKKGQGLVEYTFVIAFVTLLIAVSFGLVNGSLSAAISQSHSRVVGEFNRMNDQTERNTR